MDKENGKEDQNHEQDDDEERPAKPAHLSLAEAQIGRQRSVLPARAENRIERSAEEARAAFEAAIGGTKQNPQEETFPQPSPA